ncbi:hypothetical protein LX83_003417 [Goodfellowiella coeruleoviolacea]|uniref:Thiazole-containing bacteriocin maturation protein n=2 Tax=Goodfellowiella coeruleoviolacea TaxID=334858 RepID=A0AAE3KHL3_9PSEU|nr:hypothetical protein [Goodfellowiella coeruleoviolacea]
MYPRLKQDVRYVPCAHGVYLHSDRATVTIPGTQAFAWLDRLAPYLTGAHRLDELVAPLTPDKRDTVERLVRLLHRHGFVVDARSDRAHTLSRHEQRCYADQIAFIRYARDSAEHRFQCYRQAKVLLLGGGPVLVALLRAGLNSGWRHVRVRPGTAADAALLSQTADHGRHDPQQQVIVHFEPSDPGQDDSVLADEIAAADLVLQVCVGEASELIAVAECCASASTPLGQLLVTRTEAWFSPVGPADLALSGWRRLDGMGLSATATAAPSGSDPEPGDRLTGPVPSVLANRLALAQFRHLTGLPELPRPAGPAAPPTLVRVDLSTVDSSAHRVLPHPGTTTAKPVEAAQAQERFAALAGGQPLTPQQLLARAAVAVDARTGLFGDLDEEDFTQFPLAVCRTTLSDPFGLLPAWAPAPAVFGHGVGRDSARLAAVLAAFAGYGSLSVDRRRLTPTVDGPVVWGLDLVTGAVRAVPARLAFPVLTGCRVPYRPPTGAAAGLSWSDALVDGLRQHCVDLLVHRLAAAGAAEGPPLDPTLFPLCGTAVGPPPRLLEALGEPVSARDLTGVLGVPACALRIGRHAVVAAAPTSAQARSDALRQALLAWQSTVEGQPDCAPATVPVAWLTSAGEGGAPASCLPVDPGLPDWSRMATALCADGWTPVAVPLDHDPQATRLLPYLVQVVLLHD